MEPRGAEPETIAGGDGDGRPPFVASRSLIVATSWGLAVCLVVSAGLAVHYHQQLTDVRKRVSSIAPAAAAPNGAAVQRGSAVPISADGALLTPTSADPGLTQIVVASPEQSPALGSSAPTLPFTDIASSVTSALAPPLSSVGYVLSTGKLHTTVYLTTAAYQGVGSTEGQLLVSALIRGATAGTNYRLVGGSCEGTATDTVWAQGVADQAGVAYLSGASRTLNAGTQYFLTLDPAPATKSAALSGLEGVFAIGQAVPFVGHVTRDQGVTGGQCAIGQ